MQGRIEYPTRLLGAFGVLLGGPLLAAAYAGVRAGSREGTLATALALVPLPLFVIGFVWVARVFRARPDELGLLGLVLRLVVAFLVAAGIPSVVVLGLHASHVRATGTFVAVPTPAGTCVVELAHVGAKTELRTEGDLPKTILTALRTFSASKEPMVLIAPTLLVGANVRAYRRTAVHAEGTVTEVYGTRAGRRVWAVVKTEAGLTREVPILSVCAI